MPRLVHLLLVGVLVLVAVWVAVRLALLVYCPACEGWP